MASNKAPVSPEPSKELARGARGSAASGSASDSGVAASAGCCDAASYDGSSEPSSSAFCASHASSSACAWRPKGRGR